MKNLFKIRTRLGSCPDETQSSGPQVPKDPPENTEQFTWLRFNEIKAATDLGTFYFWLFGIVFELNNGVRCTHRPTFARLSLVRLWISLMLVRKTIIVITTNKSLMTQNVKIDVGDISHAPLRILQSAVAISEKLREQGIKTGLRTKSVLSWFRVSEASHQGFFIIFGLVLHPHCTCLQTL